MGTYVNKSKAICAICTNSNPDPSMKSNPDPNEYEKNLVRNPSPCSGFFASLLCKKRVYTDPLMILDLGIIF
jgi:hypothetical protein